MTAIRFCLPLALLAMASTATAADFPPLTGDVVDDAHVLSPATQRTLNDELAVLRHKTGHRLVVATVSSLHGRDIEAYGIDLFRTWQVGRGDHNDGAILLIAPHEHRDRIEVGYGLEGTLTDAQSKLVLHDVVRPYLTAGNTDMAALAGERAVAAVLAPPPGAVAPPVPPAPDVPWWAWLILVGFVGLVGGFFWLIFIAVRAAIRSAGGARAQASRSVNRSAGRHAGAEAAQAGRAAAEMAAATTAGMGAMRPSQSFEAAQDALRQKVEAMKRRPETVYTRTTRPSDPPEPAAPVAEAAEAAAAAETVAEALEPATTMWETPVFATAPDPVPAEPYTPPDTAAPVDDSRNYSGGTAGGGGASDSW